MNFITTAIIHGLVSSLLSLSLTHHNDHQGLCIVAEDPEKTTGDSIVGYTLGTN